MIVLYNWQDWTQNANILIMHRMTRHSVLLSSSFPRPSVSKTVQVPVMQRFTEGFENLPENTLSSLSDEGQSDIRPSVIRYKGDVNDFRN